MNYKLNEEIMFSDVTDGTAIVINHLTGIYYEINELGTCIYENLLNGASVEAILDTMNKFDDSPQDMESVLQDFIADLCKYEILVEAPKQDAPVLLNLELAQKNQFNPIVARYDDAQEMLLADPIHEVKEKTGWAPEKEALNEDSEDVNRRKAKME